MMDARSDKVQDTATTRRELVPHFAERRLLLIVGDTTIFALASALAIWLNTLLR